jgi:type IV pilus assembly protein PilE
VRYGDQGFTLIELLVVVAILGIISTMGFVAYNGYIWSTKKKQAELNLNSIYLAEQEYKSNNGEYYYKSGCSGSTTKEIVKELFDEVDNLTDQDFYYCTSGSSSSDTLTIEAYNSAKGCRIRLNEKNKLTKSGC